MKTSVGLRIALILMTLQPLTGLMACQFDPPGMTHEQWVKWVEDRNTANEAEMKQKAEGTVAQVKVKKPDAAGKDQTRVRRSFAGSSGERRSGAVNNVISLRR